MSPGCSGSLYDFVVFGKEKLHFFHKDGEEGAVEGGGQSAGVGNRGYIFWWEADLFVAMAGRDSCR